MNRSKVLRQAAFTLIELMVVIVIIAILAGVIVPNYLGRAEKAEEVAVKYDMKVLSDALEFFKMDVGRYPESLEELYAQPSDADKWHGPYLKTPPRDPWGRDYIYEPGSDSLAPFTLKSYGRDGVDGGTGEDKDYSNLDSFNDQER
jgi:general secretion pathway protein G